MGRKRNQGLLRALRLMRRLQGLRYAPTLEALAVEFGVTTRTIRRDLGALEMVGHPLPRYRKNKVKGGWYGADEA